MPILFWSHVTNYWVLIWMVVDSGADYTILPLRYAHELGIDLSRDTDEQSTGGIGGKTRVHLIKKLWQVRLGDWERQIPFGILDNNDIPPLLGRHCFLETFKVTFHKHVTIFFEDK